MTLNIMPKRKVFLKTCPLDRLEVRLLTDDVQLDYKFLYFFFHNFLPFTYVIIIFAKFKPKRILNITLLVQSPFITYFINHVTIFIFT